MHMNIQAYTIQEILPLFKLSLHDFPLLNKIQEFITK